jgi:uncharacterized OB-fold protein
MLERIANPAEVRRWEGGLPVAHRYTPGVAGEVFFTALRDRGVLLGSRCEPCAFTYVPARLFCERCFSELDANVELGPGGEVVSFTIAYVDVDERPIDEPVMYGLVRLDGADAVMVHRVIQPADAPLEIGARVEVVLEPEEARAGSILDIRGFRVLEDARPD